MPSTDYSSSSAFPQTVETVEKLGSALSFVLAGKVISATRDPGGRSQMMGRQECTESAPEKNAGKVQNWIVKVEKAVGE